MEHLHTRKFIQRGKTVSVRLDIQANVQLMDDHNYRNYCNGGMYEYYGGLATRTPFNIVVPQSGTWNIVIDLGGNSGSIRHSIEIY